MDYFALIKYLYASATISTLNDFKFGLDRKAIFWFDSLTSWIKFPVLQVFSAFD